LYFYKFIFNNKTHLNKNKKYFYWYMNILDNVKTYGIRDYYILNILAFYNNTSNIIYTYKKYDETICIDSCPLTTNDPTIIEFDTYA
jgi:hypothetical protein